jgi:ELWxxDGT repeat protein
MSIPAHGKALLVLLVLSLSSSVFAAAPYQVADLNTSVIGVPSQPVWRSKLNNVVFFQTHATGEQPALWRTDGTAAGTFKLLSLQRPPSPFGPISGMTVSGNVVYFDAYDAEGRRIWKSDGTVAGTVPITATLNRSMLVMAVVGTKVICRIRETGELWSVDASSAQPIKVAGAPNESWSAWTTFQGRLYLGTPSGLWRSDGTVDGTIKIASTPAWYVIGTDSQLFFIGSGSTAGVEPWVSDGTEAGTHMIADLKPGTASTFRLAESFMGRLDGSRVMFLGMNGELGISDGTSSGTRVIRTGVPPAQGGNFASLNGRLYFPFDDGQQGREIWRSDGTDAGTAIVSDLSSRSDTLIAPLIAGATRLYFYSQGPNHRELFESDGTAAGTHIVHQPPATGWSGSDLSVLTMNVVGDTVFFSAADAEHGDEPWISDGTDAGTHMLANVDPDTAGSSSPGGFFAGTDRLYFTATSDKGRAVFRTDGTAAGTVPVVTSGAILPQPFAVSGNTLFVKKDAELWKTDGTPDSFTKVSAFPGKGLLPSGVSVNGRLYFFVSDDLWASDGTPGGTAALTAASTTPERPSTPVFNLAGRAYFLGQQGAQAGVLYATDGTASGTRSVARMDDRTSGLWAPPSALGGSLLAFTDNQRDNESLLWRFSTAAGDATILHHFPGSSYNHNPTTAVIGTTMLFSWKQDAQHPDQIWKTDGTAAGTVLVKEFPLIPSSLVTTLEGMVSLGSRVVFTINDGAHGTEPWVSDGTPEGTKLLLDIRAGASGSTAGALTVVDGTAYFSADDGVHGQELWQTDGTPEGTQLVADIEPGAAGSSPYPLTKAGDLLYFAATTTVSGRELWAYPLSSAAVTVDDVRGNERDRLIVVPIRLTRAARQRVTVSYATADDSAKAGIDYTAVSGTITFEAGETVKPVTIPLGDDTRPSGTRSFFVRVSNAGIPIERTAATAIIEDDDTIVDVAVSLTGTNYEPLVNVRNAGPSPASNVKVCVANPPTLSTLQCGVAFELAVGETHSQQVQSSGGTIVARVTQFEPDSDPANNAATWIAVGGFSSAMYISPPSLHVGETGSLTVVQDKTAGTTATIKVTSSDPSVISTPATITIPGNTVAASVPFQALKPGTATISATTAYTTHIASVRVLGANESPRTAAVLVLNSFTVWEFGRPTRLSATVAGTTSSGVLPTGSVSFFEEGALIATAPLVKQSAELMTPAELTGLNANHLITAKYNGDANFLETALLPSMQVFFRPGTPSFGAMFVPLTQNVAIVVKGLGGYPPAGTITVLENGSTPRTVSGPLVASGDGSSTATATGFSSAARTIAITYSGDSHYSPNTVTIPIAFPRLRAVR